MSEMSPFEIRLSARLAGELDAAVRPFDPHAIAGLAMHGRRALTPRRRLVLIAAVVALLVGAAVAVGAGWIRIPVRQPPLPWPLQGVLEPAGSLRTASQVPMVAVLRDGRVLIVTAELSNQPNPPAEIWDPTTGALHPVGALTKAGDGSQLVVLADGRVLVVGGDGAGWEPTAEIFDPLTETFSVVRSRPSTIDGTAILLRDGRVLLTGGAEEVDAAAGENRGVSSRAEVFDPATNTFAPVQPMNRPRVGHHMELRTDGRVVVYGGGTNWISPIPPPEVELFDPVANRFEPAPQPLVVSGPADRWARLTEDKVLRLRPLGLYPDHPRAMTLMEYDLMSGIATADPAIPANAPVYDVLQVLPLNDRRVLVYGFDKASRKADDFGIVDRGWIGVLDLDTGKLAEVAVRDQSWGTAVALPGGQVLIAGGTRYDQCTFQGQTQFCSNDSPAVDIVR